jgi:hypothetical protein
MGSKRHITTWDGRINEESTFLEEECRRFAVAKGDGEMGQAQGGHPST